MFTLLRRALAAVPAPPAGMLTFFAADDGNFYLKDDAGVVHDLGAVTSVNGKVGDVVLTAEDVGATAPGDLAEVATSGDYGDLLNRPTLGAAAALDVDAVGGLPRLIAGDGGAPQLPSAYVPQIAITDVFPVESEAEQLALDAQVGDVAIRSDLLRSFIRNRGTSGTMADWTLLPVPASPVLSVNGQIGAVTLGAGDVGAQPASSLLASLAGLTVTANQGLYASGAGVLATYTLSAGGRALGNASGAANSIPFFSAANTVGAITTTTGGRALLNNAGTANTIPYYSAANTVALAPLTAAGRALLDDADAAAQRTTLGLGSAATAATGDFATAAQGTKADSAVQPGILAAVATSGSYADLTSKPLEFGVYVYGDAPVPEGEYPASRSSASAGTLTRWFVEVDEPVTIDLVVNGSTVASQAVPAGANTYAITQAVAAGDRIAFLVWPSAATSLWTQVDRGIA